MLWVNVKQLFKKQWLMQHSFNQLKINICKLVIIKNRLIDNLKQ